MDHEAIVARLMSEQRSILKVREAILSVTFDAFVTAAGAAGESHDDLIERSLEQSTVDVNLHVDTKKHLEASRLSAHSPPGGSYFEVPVYPSQVSGAHHI
jgi:hypothetical protein